MQSFAWSPDPAYEDLTAVGLLTGRTILLRITETPFYTSNPTPSIVHLNVRHPRPCNVVAFSPNEPNLIVTGYDKVRDNSLLIWDIKGAFGSGGSSSSPPAVNTNPGQDENDGYPLLGKIKSPLSAASNTTTTPASVSDIKPIAQFGLSEQVSAATFLHSPRTLIAAMALKWIRCYDLRANPASNSNATAIMASRSVSSLVADPFDSHRFSSVGEDGIVRIWDLRHSNEPILTFSSEDGIAKSNDRKTQLARQASKLSLTPSNSTVTGGNGAATISMAFSPTRRGHLATLDRDTNHLSAWNIFEVESNSTIANGKGKDDQGISDGAGLMLRSASQEETAPLPTLYYERRSRSQITFCPFNVITS